MPPWSARSAGCANGRLQCPTARPRDRSRSFSLALTRLRKAPRAKGKSEKLNCCTFQRRSVERWRYNHRMYHYDPNTALEELTEDATLPNPVHVRDMILRRKLTADKSLELNRLFVEYQKFFGETQKLGKEILQQLTS